MTEDRGMDVSPSWQDLERERDQLADWRENVLAKWESLSARPDGGELMDLGNALIDSPQYTHRRHVRQLEALRKLKAQWQVDALEEAATEIEQRHGYMLGTVTPLELRQMATEKRRQAEGAAHEADAP